MLTVADTAQRVGWSPGTVRRWIHTDSALAQTTHDQRSIDHSALDEVRDEMYPMLPRSPEWRKPQDGTSAPNCVAAVALSRLGR
jgi:hypothetical protein